MPIYEYRCVTCQERFEALVYASTKVACPECGSDKLEKQFSSFAVGGTTTLGERAANCDVASGGG
jgi:putative FmdB family regulatory protein